MRFFHILRGRAFSLNFEYPGGAFLPEPREPREVDFLFIVRGFLRFIVSENEVFDLQSDPSSMTQIKTSSGNNKLCQISLSP